MEEKIYSVIASTGSYIPEKVIKNEDFIHNQFYDSQGKKIDLSTEEIIKKFEQITEIKERRYVKDDQVASDIAWKIQPLIKNRSII